MRTRKQCQLVAVQRQPCCCIDVVEESIIELMRRESLSAEKIECGGAEAISQLAEMIVQRPTTYSVFL